MAIAARRRVGITTPSALKESAQWPSDDASSHRFHQRSVAPMGLGEPIHEIVVVPVAEIVAKLPTEALALRSGVEHALIQVTPIMDASLRHGPICLSIAAIQQACPYLFLAGYQAEPGALIQVSEHHVFLGQPSH